MKNKVAGACQYRQALGPQPCLDEAAYAGGWVCKMVGKECWIITKKQLKEMPRYQRRKIPTTLTWKEELPGDAKKPVKVLHVPLATSTDLDPDSSNLLMLSIGECVVAATRNGRSKPNQARLYVYSFFFWTSLSSRLPTLGSSFCGESAYEDRHWECTRRVSPDTTSPLSNVLCKEFLIL